MADSESKAESISSAVSVADSESKDESISSAAVGKKPVWAFARAVEFYRKLLREIGQLDSCGGGLFILTGTASPNILLAAHELLGDSVSEKLVVLCDRPTQHSHDHRFQVLKTRFSDGTSTQLLAKRKRASLLTMLQFITTRCSSHSIELWDISPNQGNPTAGIDVAVQPKLLLDFMTKRRDEQTMGSGVTLKLSEGGMGVFATKSFREGDVIFEVSSSYCFLLHLILYS